MKVFPVLLPCLVILAQSALPQTAPIRKVANNKAPVAAPKANFKESGSPNAPIVFELYTDYQCPACREFYLGTLPQLITDYVNTGKVRLLHRDFPLSGHQYSKLATRYANAAGTISKADYEAVAHELFEMQPEWAQKGDVDNVVSKALSPADFAKVKALATGPDTSIDQTVLTDVAMGNADHLAQTPTMVFVIKGKREVVGGGMPYSILKSYLDRKLAQ